MSPPQEDDSAALFWGRPSLYQNTLIKMEFHPEGPNTNCCLHGSKSRGSPRENGTFLLDDGRFLNAPPNENRLSSDWNE